jgi:nucleotidyltransferase substrate binding protein (TIGR01987 family)
MEKLIFKIQDLEDALATLEAALSEQEKIVQTGNTRFALMVQDSVIKRFEYTFDCFWKVLKLFLEKKFNLQDVNSPKSVLHAPVKYGLLTEPEGDLAIAMVGDKNETSHNYDRAKAHQIGGNIKGYAGLMEAIIERLKINTGAMP